MEKIAEIHQDHLLIHSDIAFYNTEINFLKKLLSAQYADTTNHEEIRLLDNYWKEFDRIKEDLRMLDHKINANEYNFKQMYLQAVENIYEAYTEEERIVIDFYSTREKLKLLKESFYSFMTESRHRFV